MKFQGPSRSLSPPWGRQFSDMVNSGQIWQAVAVCDHLRSKPEPLRRFERRDDQVSAGGKRCGQHVIVIGIAGSDVRRSPSR
jgi:hypothetical protein